MSRLLNAVTIAVPMVGSFAAFGWLAYIGWFGGANETQQARERLMGIQQALQTQKQMVDIALMHEAVLGKKELSHDAFHRVEQLEKYRRMLQPMEDEW
jgi:hypothetical protein